MLAVAALMSGGGWMTTPVSGASTNARQTQDDDAVRLRRYYSGNGLLNRGMHRLAADEYEAFLAEHPADAKAPTARYGLGVCRYRLNQFDAAVAVLAPLVDLPDPPFPAETLMLLGRSEMALGEHASAAARFRTLIDRHADSTLAPDAAALAAEASYRAGEMDLVETPRARLASLAPDSPLRARTELFAGLAAVALERDAAAVQRFDTVLERGGSEPSLVHQAALLRAQTLHRLGRLADAAAAYEAIIKEGPEAQQADALYGRAAIHHGAGKPRAAARLLERLLRHHADAEPAAPATLLAGRIEIELGAYDAGDRMLRQLAARPSELQDDARYWRAKGALRAGKAADAAEQLRIAIRSHPKSNLIAEMTYDRAAALLQANESEAALNAFDAFLDQHAGHRLAPEAALAAAHIEHQTGAYAASRERCRGFTRTWPDHARMADAAFLLAENRFLAGDDDAAIDDYRAWLTAHPDHARAPAAGFRLGVALHRAGRSDDARPYLLNAAAQVGDDPSFRPALLALGDAAMADRAWKDAEQWFEAYLAPSEAGPAAAADEALLKLGVAAQRQGDHPRAIEAFDTLLARKPAGDLRVHATFERGQALLMMNRNDEAADAFEAVANAGASRFRPFALNHLGVLAGKAGDQPAAARWFEAAAARSDDPAFAAGALDRQGQAELAAGRYEEAARTFTTLIKRKPGPAATNAAQARRAIAWSRLGRDRDALEAMSSLTIDGKQGLSATLATALLYEKAWVLRRLDRPDDAAATYRTLLARPGGDEKLRAHGALELAELAMEAGRPDEADEVLATIEPTLKSDLGDTLREDIAYRRAVASYRAGDLKAAGERLSSFLDAHPKSRHAATAALLAGEAFYQAGAHRKAIPHLERAAASTTGEDQRGAALLRLGESAAALQRWKVSHDAFAAHRADFPASPLWFQAAFGASWALENQGELDEAIAGYREIVAGHQGETAARAQFQLGECLYARKEYLDAARELLRVDILYDYPAWSAAALYEAGRCLTAAGDRAEARTLFQQVQANHGDTEWARLAGRRLEELSRPGIPGR